MGEPSRAWPPGHPAGRNGGAEPAPEQSDAPPASAGEPSAAALVPAPEQSDAPPASAGEPSAAALVPAPEQPDAPPASAGEPPAAPPEPSWASVLATTIRLWLERRARRGPARAQPGRRSASRTLSLIAYVVVIFLAGALAVALVRHTPAAVKSAGSRRGDPGSAAVARSDAAGWIAREVSPGAIVACDPVMCSALQARGFPAGSLLMLGPSASDPLGSAVVVATAAVRAQFGRRLTSVYAPAVIASFGSGSALVQVLVTAPDGAAAYQVAQQADLRARRAAGQQLLDNPRITCPAQVRSELVAGDVDARLLITLAALAAEHPVSILSFGDRGPGAGPGVPLRAAELAGPAGPGGASYLSSSLAFLRAQRAPFLASTISTARLASGRTMLRVGFAAPSPLGLLGALSSTRHPGRSGAQEAFSISHVNGMKGGRPPLACPGRGGRSPLACLARSGRSPRPVAEWQVTPRPVPGGTRNHETPHLDRAASPDRPAGRGLAAS